MEKTYIGTTFLSYQGLDYVISYSLDRAIIFSTEIMDEIQTIRNLRNNLVCILKSDNGCIYLLMTDSIQVLQPQLQQGGQIIWKKQY